MISRDEAFEMLVTVSDEWNQKQQQALNAIYDSIGSCGECVNLHKYVSIGGNNCFICRRLGDKHVKSDWFCSDFERKNIDR